MTDHKLLLTASTQPPRRANIRWDIFFNTLLQEVMSRSPGRKGLRNFSTSIAIMLSALLPPLLLLSVAAKAADIISRVQTPECKYLPGDANWPSQDEWAALNSSVGGRLIATSPLGSACHDPTFDEKLCTSLQEEWLYSGIQ